MKKTPTPQQICEKQAMAWFDNLEEKGHIEYTDITFSEIYEANLPKDSLFTYTDLLNGVNFWQEKYNRYKEQYGEDTTGVIDEYFNYRLISDSLKICRDKLNNYETNIYTVNNYVIECSFVQNVTYTSYWIEKFNSFAVFVFNEKYDLIDTNWKSKIRIYK